MQPVQPRCEKDSLIFRVQTIEPDILQTVIVGAVVKSIDHIKRGWIWIHTPCTGVCVQFSVVRRGKTIFKFKLAVIQNVLADVAQVDVQLPAGLIFRILIERVHHPELNVFDVGSFEIRCGQGTLDSSPPLLWVF